MSQPAQPRLSADDIAAVDALVAPADATLTSAYPGAPATRQPVHTVYVPADAVRPGLTGDWGRQALRAIDEFAPTAANLSMATGIARDDVEAAWEQLRAKLASEPIEDLRIDLEDGYGPQSDAQEDADVVRAVGTVVADLQSGQAPACWGVRFSSFESATRSRGLRTLDLAVGAAASNGRLAPGFVLTLPKVTSVEQVLAMVLACERLESAYGLGSGNLQFEVQVEMPQVILGADGAATIARVVHAGAGRVTSLHYGTYDYSAALGIAAQFQSMEHPAADHAKAVMQLAAAGTGVRICDGSTNVLPVGSLEEVHAAWRLHARLVRRSLERGYYQGWDLHPAQLVTRHLANAVFYRAGLPAAGRRLRAYTAKQSAGVLDEPATARALADFVLRGIDCGAVQPAEALELSGCNDETLRLLAHRLIPTRLPTA